MSAIDRITPILARLVVAVGLITALASVIVIALIGEPRLLLFTAVSVLSAVYGQQVVDQHRVGKDRPEASVHPLAA